MGKAIVTTPAGINGLDDLKDGSDVVVVHNGEQMARVIIELINGPERREAIQHEARKTVENRYG